ncbi:unnamed protein product [Camellia sinensis]
MLLCSSPCYLTLFFANLFYSYVGATFLQAVSWIAITILSSSNNSFFKIILYLLLGNFGALIVEVANDAIVAETGKQPSAPPKNSQMSSLVLIRESSLNLPKSPSNVGIRKQLSELLVALRKPEIAHSITWFAASHAIIPALTGTMFFYQTRHLDIDSSVLVVCKVFEQVAMLLWVSHIINTSCPFRRRN